MKSHIFSTVLRAEKRTVCLPHLRGYLEKLRRKMLLHHVTLDNRSARKTKAWYIIRPWTKQKLETRGRPTRAEKFVISDLSQGYVNQRNLLRIWRTKSKITKWTKVLHPIRNCVAAKVRVLLGQLQHEQQNCMRQSASTITHHCQLWRTVARINSIQKSEETTRKNMGFNI